MTVETTDTAPSVSCESGKPDRETVRKWLINFQHDEVMRRYENIPHGEHLRELFVKYMYPDYEHRGDYEARNELFRWAANVYKSGKIDRLLGAASFFMSRYLDALKTEKELPFYIDAVIESYDLTREIDERMVDTLWSMIESEADLTAENYRRAYNSSSTREQRCRQMENLVYAGDYAKSIIERGGLIDFLIENLPRIPLLSRHKFVHALNEATGMVRAAYRAFKKSREHLVDLRETIRSLELGYIDDMFYDTTPPAASEHGSIKPQTLPEKPGEKNDA